MSVQKIKKASGVSSFLGEISGIDGQEDEWCYYSVHLDALSCYLFRLERWKISHVSYRLSPL